MVKRQSGKVSPSTIIAVGGLAQISRNKKVNDIGELGIFVGIVALLGGLLKWILWKPIVFAFKLLIIIYKWFFILCWRCAKLSFKLAKEIMIKLYSYIKIKYSAKKAI